MTLVYACSKTGHSSTPKGLSRVGMGKGMDLRAPDDMVGSQCAVVYVTMFDA